MNQSLGDECIVEAQTGIAQSLRATEGVESGNAFFYPNSSSKMCSKTNLNRFATCKQNRQILSFAFAFSPPN
jgi:hypothetical protein